MLLYGDSLSQQLFVSLASLAGGVESSWRPAGCERMRHLECVKLCVGAVSTPALLCQRTKFGLALDETPPRPRNCSVQPSLVASARDKFPTFCVRRFDLVVLSEVAHWVGVDGALGLQDCLERHGLTAAEAARRAQEHVASLYERQMRRNAKHLHELVTDDRLGVDLEVKHGKSSEPLRATRVLFRTSPPGYPTSDLLPPDTPKGEPPVFTAPSRSTEWARTLAARSTSRYNHHMIPRLNALARRAYADVGVLDVEAPMTPRIDGHLDFLHYCLPGPADFYSEALYNYAL